MDFSAILLSYITDAVRDADEGFRRTGGSSRHWVDDWFLPMLKKRGLDIFKADEVYSLQAENADLKATLDRRKKWHGQLKTVFKKLLDEHRRGIQEYAELELNQ